MRLISKYNKVFRVLLYVIKVYRKYALFVPLKWKKEFKGNKGSESYIRSMESWLQDNYTEIYSTNNEWKSVVAERLIGTLKNRTTFFSASPLRKAYTNKLANIVNYYNNIYDMTIKMKPADVKERRYIDLAIKYAEEDPTC